MDTFFLPGVLEVGVLEGILPLGMFLVVREGVLEGLRPITTAPVCFESFFLLRFPPVRRALEFVDGDDLLMEPAESHNSARSCSLSTSEPAKLVAPSIMSEL